MRGLLLLWVAMSCGCYDLERLRTLYRADGGLEAHAERYFSPFHDDGEDPARVPGPADVQSSVQAARSLSPCPKWKKRRSSTCRSLKRERMT